jgi:hypothetical protein
MNKNNNIIKLLINLAKFVFSEVEFNKFISFVKLNLFNSMRLYVEEKVEMLETKLVLYRDNAILEAQLVKCKKLDDIVTDLYIDNLAVVYDK